MKQLTDKFYLGSHLCREPMPSMDEMKRDMENLKRHGFNLIKLQEHWAIDEPAEGQYDFSRYEELIAHAATLDLGIYLGLTCEQAPAWLYRKHPDCRMVGSNGVPVIYEAPTTLPGDGKPGPCFDHPGALADQCRFITRLVETLGQYENMVIWNTWQEIAYWSQGIVGTPVCYCAQTLAHFRRWLAARYGDLDTLNRAWNTRYAAWEDIAPVRAAGGGVIASAVEINWRYFMDNVQIGEVLRARAEAIRAADPHHRPVFAHKGGPAIGAGQDWTYARCQDFVGSSCYPAWAPLQKWDDGQARPLERETALYAEMAGVALTYDEIRSCNPPGSPVWAAEFQGGPISTGFQKGRVPSPEDLRRWMLTAVASGVTALSFWVTRAEIMLSEQNGFSLLDSAGETTPRLEEAARVGAALQAHADLFAQPTFAPAQVGILVNEWNHQLCSLLAQGGEHLSYVTRGWHRLLWEANIPADFVEVSHLQETPLEQYKALVLPFPLSLSEEVAANLKRYVEQGGHLICEAAPGRVDENAFCTRGELSPTMAALCGVRQESFTMVHEPETPERWSPSERTWGEYLDAAALEGTGLLAGHRLRANIYVETFTCTDSEPILCYGDAVAGAVRRAGAGSAWLLGTYAGHNGTAYRDADTRAALIALFAQCGIEQTYRGQLLLRKRVTPHQEAWIFTNPTAVPMTEQIDVTGWTKVEDLFGESLEHMGDNVVVNVESLDVRVLLLSSSTG
ncbi:MAG: beta-galactosidase [Armatimonadota bacterium]